jgi:hypothetical protein
MWKLNELKRHADGKNDPSFDRSLRFRSDLSALRLGMRPSAALSEV